MNKRTFLVGLASSMLSYAAAASEASSTALELRIDQVSPSGQMKVSMHNTGQAPLRLWRGRLGIGRWRVLHISASSGQLTTYYEDPDQIADGRPLYMEAKQGKPLQEQLNLTSPFWLPRREERSGDNIWATGDTLIVIYDVPMSAEGGKFGVWWGVAAAKTIVE